MSKNNHKYLVEVFTDDKFKNINSFLVYTNKKEALLINCWIGSVDKINKFIIDNELSLKYIFISHGLYEYINGIDQVYLNNNEPEVYIGKEDLKNLYDSQLNLSAIYNNVDNYTINQSVRKINVINEESEFFLGDLKICAYPKTSQTYGSLIFSISQLKMIFSGSALFCYNRTYAFDDKTIEDWDKTMFWIVKKFSKKYKLMPSHDEYDISMREVLKNNLFLRDALKIVKNNKKKSKNINK